MFEDSIPRSFAVVVVVVADSTASFEFVVVVDVDGVAIDGAVCA